jgi:hypothetical protein
LVQPDHSHKCIGPYNKQTSLTHTYVSFGTARSITQRIPFLSKNTNTYVYLVRAHHSRVYSHFFQIDQTRICMQLKSHRGTELHQKRSNATPVSIARPEIRDGYGISVSQLPWSILRFLTLPCPYLPGSGLACSSYSTSQWRPRWRNPVEWTAFSTTLKVCRLLPPTGVGSAAFLHDDAIFTYVDALCTTCPAWLLGISCTAPSHI